MLKLGSCDSRLRTAWNYSDLQNHQWDFENVRSSVASQLIPDSTNYNFKAHQLRPVGFYSTSTDLINPEYKFKSHCKSWGKDKMHAMKNKTNLPTLENKFKSIEHWKKYQDVHRLDSPNCFLLPHLSLHTHTHTVYALNFIESFESTDLSPPNSWAYL